MSKFGPITELYEVWNLFIDRWIQLSQQVEQTKENKRTAYDVTVLCDISFSYSEPSLSTLGTRCKIPLI